MPSFQHAGRRLSYLDTADRAVAPSPRPNPRVLLMLHAFPLHSEMWAEQLEAAPPGWRVIAPDYPGFGSSELRADDESPLTMDQYGVDVIALLDHLDIQQATLVGLSMGGYVAFSIWRLAPERVGGLVLADTKSEGDSEEARTGRLQTIRLLHREGVEAVVEQMLPRLICARALREQPEVVARVRAMALANSAEGVGRALLALMERPDSTPLLPALRCPTLVIVGSQDGVTPPSVAREMQRRIRGAALIEIPDAGHLSNMEQPARFNQALREFLRNVEAA